WLLETWAQSLGLGRALPTVPLWLADDLAVPLELDESYEQSCGILNIPLPWRCVSRSLKPRSAPAANRPWRFPSSESPLASSTCVTAPDWLSANPQAPLPEHILPTSQ